MSSLLSALMPEEPSYRAALPLEAVSAVGGMSSVGMFFIIPNSSPKAKLILTISASALGFLSATLWSAARKQAEEDKKQSAQEFSSAAFGKGIAQRVCVSVGEAMSEAGSQISKKLRSKAMSALCKSIIAQFQEAYFPGC